MNEKLVELFNGFKHFRFMQEIVNEILTLDYYVDNYDEEKVIELIDFCLTKYNKEIKQIGGVYKDTIVVEDDPDFYEEKDEEEIDSDCEYVRDCLIIIGAVKSGIRDSYKQVVDEISWEE